MSHRWISEKHKYECLAIPKVACTTIKRTLCFWETGELVPEDRLWELHTLEQPELAAPHFYRFTFVRNPYDRLFATWKSKILSEEDLNFDWCREELPDKSFATFVNWVCRSGNVDPHWARQIDIILDSSPLAFNEIGSFETFDLDFPRILDRLGAPEEVIRVGQEVTNKSQDIEMEYTQELADLVFNYYSADFNTFLYERDSWACSSTGRAGAS
jgi:hypothetical protein